MEFAVVCIGALIVLGLVAAVVSHYQGGDDGIKVGHDCASCTSADDGSCQLHCLLEEKKQREDNKTAPKSVL